MKPGRGFDSEEEVKMWCASFLELQHPEISDIGIVFAEHRQEGVKMLLYHATVIDMFVVCQSEL